MKYPYRLVMVSTLWIGFGSLVHYYGIGWHIDKILWNPELPRQLLLALEAEVAEGPMTLWTWRRHHLPQWKHLPWVKSITWHRSKGHCLRLHIETHTPLARWIGGGVFVAEQGYQADWISERGDLPLLKAPESARDRVFAEWSAFLPDFQAHQIKMHTISVSVEGIWVIELDNYVQVALGHQEIVERAQHFARSYDKVLSDRIDYLTYVDMRYTQGMALGRRKSP